jgi:hypothetical protein
VVRGFLVLVFRSGRQHNDPGLSHIGVISAYYFNYICSGLGINDGKQTWSWSMVGKVTSPISWAPVGP